MYVYTGSWEVFEVKWQNEGDERKEGRKMEDGDTRLIYIPVHPKAKGGPERPVELMSEARATLCTSIVTPPHFEHRASKSCAYNIYSCSMHPRKLSIRITLGSPIATQWLSVPNSCLRRSAPRVTSGLGTAIWGACTRTSAPTSTRRCTKISSRPANSVVAEAMRRLSTRTCICTHIYRISEISSDSSR